MRGDKELSEQGYAQGLGEEAIQSGACELAEESVQEAGGDRCCEGVGRPARSPGNRLEKLAGDREGQHSVRINQRYRICFVWEDGNAYEVEVTDYH